MSVGPNRYGAAVPLPIFVISVMPGFLVETWEDFCEEVGATVLLPIFGTPAMPGFIVEA